MTALTSSFLGTARSQLEEVSALLEQKPAPVGAVPNPVGRAAANYLSTLSSSSSATRPKAAGAMETSSRSSSSSSSSSSSRPGGGGPSADAAEKYASEPLSYSAGKAALIFAPPLAVAYAFPDVFEAALEFGGTYGDLVLFGLLPVAMAWSQRREFECGIISSEGSSIGSTTDGSSIGSSSIGSSSGSSGGGWSSRSAALASSRAAAAWSAHSAAALQEGASRRSGAVSGPGEEGDDGYDDDEASAASNNGYELNSNEQNQPVVLIPGGNLVLAALGTASAALITSYTMLLIS